MRLHRLLLLLIPTVLTLLSGCQTVRAPEDALAEGHRQARLHVAAKHGLVEGEYDFESDVKNRGWRKLYREIVATEDTMPTAEQKEWQDRIHTVFAIYVSPKSTEKSALWVFVDRKTGLIVGDLVSRPGGS